MTELNFVEMLYQVMGEFEERMENRHLTLMTHLPDSPAMIYADGRRMWRILENLFGNILKYAMENTRVYAEVLLEKDQVIFTLKNISAQPLNIPAEELTERFTAAMLPEIQKAADLDYHRTDPYPASRWHL